MKFCIESLSHGQADCFLLAFENNNGDECNILIDGNCEGENKNVRERIAKLKKVDCIVVTHVDNDHIGGILNLFEEKSEEVICIRDQIKDSIIIYNKLTDKIISYKQAERFEDLSEKKQILNSYSNRYNNQGKMLKFLSVKIRKILKFNELNKNNVYITFLRPDIKGVRQVINDYQKNKFNEKATNAKIVNKNSIVLLIEFAGKKVLFTGDAFSEDIKDAINILNDENLEDSVNELDLIKIPHHGAEEYNKNLMLLIEQFKCKKLIVTGKRQWDEKHPSKMILDNLLMADNQIQLYTNVDFKNIDNNKYEKIYNDLDLKNYIDIL